MRLLIFVDSALSDGGDASAHDGAEAMEVDPTGALILYADREGQFIDCVYAPGVWAYAEYRKGE